MSVGARRNPHRCSLHKSIRKPPLRGQQETRGQRERRTLGGFFLAGRGDPEARRLHSSKATAQCPPRMPNSRAGQFKGTMRKSSLQDTTLGGLCDRNRTRKPLHSPRGLNNGLPSQHPPLTHQPHDRKGHMEQRDAGVWGTWILRGDTPEFPKLPPRPRFGASAMKVTFFLASWMQHQRHLDVALNRAPEASALSWLFPEERS